MSETYTYNELLDNNGSIMFKQSNLDRHVEIVSASGRRRHEIYLTPDQWIMLVRGFDGGEHAQ